MITVAGEALIDLIVDPAGHIDPRFGGGPFNVVRAVARLGLPSAFLGRLSSDRFGRLMREDLDRHGVQAAIEAPTDAPTTLAMVDVDPAGVPGYHFYLADTSAAAIGPGQAIVPADTTALHIGSLGLVMEPVGTSLEQLVASLPAGITVMLDPNCRPGAIDSRQAYLDRLDRILRRVDLIKTSTEDLGYLFPGQGAEQAAAELLARGPACVVVTDGAAAVRAFAAGHEIRAEVPPANVVDTVGAGDAFGGAFLTWWIGNGFGRDDLHDPDTVRRATRAAVYASVVTCTRRGAEPPWAYELVAHDGWGWLPSAQEQPGEPQPADAVTTGGCAPFACPSYARCRRYGCWPRSSALVLSRMPRMNAAWPACCRQSEITLTSRTLSVTGGSQPSSTTRDRSASVTPETSRMVCSCTASWYPVSRSPEGTVTWATCSELCPYPMSAAPNGSSNRLPYSAHTCGTPNASARWSSCTRARCQISQAIELASRSSRAASWLAVRPRTASCAVSWTRPKASVRISAVVIS